MDNAKDLFEHELRDIYDAETKLVRATNKMAAKCSDAKLVKGLQKHSEMTAVQAQRLEQVFEMIGRKPRREACVGINGLIEEFTKFLQEKPSAEVLDAFATGAAEKVEKYEICAYNSLIELAKLLSLPKAVDLFKRTLSEEEQTAAWLETMSKELGPRMEAPALSA